MYAAIIVFIIIAAVLLVLVILAQNSKGGGVSSQFGGSSANQMIGAQNTTNLLEKITWGLVTAILILSLGANFAIDRNQGTIPSSPNVEKAKKSNPTQQPIAPVPGNTPAENNSGQNKQNPGNQDTKPTTDKNSNQPKK